MNQEEEGKSPIENFYRHFHNEQAALDKRICSLKDTTLNDSERAELINQALTDIAHLSNEVKDASNYVPAYDQRLYSESLKNLSQTLQETRTSLAPKRKFAFKKSQALAPSATATSGAAIKPVSAQGRPDPDYAHFSPPGHPGLSTPLEKKPLDLIPQFPIPKPFLNPTSQTTNPNPTLPLPPPTSKTITLTSQSSTRLTLPPLPPSPSIPISLSHLQNCLIDLSPPPSSSPHPPFANLTITNLTACLVLCPSPVAGAAHITAAHGCTFLLTSRQVRMHGCGMCVVYLRCSSRPIIEDCRDVRFAPLPGLFDPPQHPPPLPNLWNLVDDFKWLKAEHSPNWSVLAPEDRVSDEVWKAVVAFGGDGDGTVWDCLRAVGVGRGTVHM